MILNLIMMFDKESTQLIRLETYPYMFVQTIKLHNSVYPLFIAFWSTSLRLENAEKKKTCMEENGSFIRLLIPTKNTATKSIVLSKKASFNPHLVWERRVDWLCNFCLSFTLAEVKVKKYFIQNKSSLKKILFNISRDLMQLWSGSWIHYWFISSFDKV